jgi:ubiquinone/menaquinone biosynthesis C-methylase UbiE
MLKNIHLAKSLMLYIFLHKYFKLHYLNTKVTYYDKISSGYDGLYKEEQINKIKLLLNHLPIHSRDKVLDVGCGSGLYWDMLPSADILGLDSSASLIKLVKGKAILGRAEDLPFEDSSFDVVICISALHNFSNIKESLREMIRVGRKRFAVTVLKRSCRYDYIVRCVYATLQNVKCFDERKDTIFVKTE